MRALRKIGRRLYWRWCSDPFGYLTRLRQHAKHGAVAFRHRWRVRRGVRVDWHLFTLMVRRRQYRESIRWNTYLRRDPCSYCLRRLAETSMTVEHVVPRGRGGVDRSSNKVAACKTCNNRRGSIPLLLFLMSTKRRPPRGMTGDDAQRLRLAADLRSRASLRVPMGELARWRNVRS